MLIGENAPSTIAERVVGPALIVAFLTPWFLMGAGMLFVGLLALGPRQGDIPDLWICLPGGVALLLVVGLILFWVFWRMPRQTISYFEFDGGTLTLVTRMYGRVTRPADELREVVEERGRRGRGLRGWWLRFRQDGWVFLRLSTSNAKELVQQIGPGAGYSPVIR
jgi:hypothetical protein